MADTIPFSSGHEKMRVMFHVHVIRMPFESEFGQISDQTCVPWSGSWNVSMNFSRKLFCLDIPSVCMAIRVNEVDGIIHQQMHLTNFLDASEYPFPVKNSSMTILGLLGGKQAFRLNETSTSNSISPVVGCSRFAHDLLLSSLVMAHYRNIIPMTTVSFKCSMCNSYSVLFICIILGVLIINLKLIACKRMTISIVYNKWLCLKSGWIRVLGGRILGTTTTNYYLLNLHFVWKIATSTFLH